MAYEQINYLHYYPVTCDLSAAYFGREVLVLWFKFKTRTLDHLLMEHRNQIFVARDTSPKLYLMILLLPKKHFSLVRILPPPRFVQ